MVQCPALQCKSSRILPRAYLYRSSQKTLCTRSQLLFLSRCFGCLPLRLPAKLLQRCATAFSLLCIGLFNAHGSTLWTPDMWLGLPFRTGTGAALQAAHTQNQAKPWFTEAHNNQILYHHILSCSSSFSLLLLGWYGRTSLLQVYLPSRYSRSSPSLSCIGCGYSRFIRRSLHLEACSPNYDPRSQQLCLSSLLSLPMPTGSDLFPF